MWDFTVEEYCDITSKSELKDEDNNINTEFSLSLFKP
jgi:hypothetical protein